MGTRKAMRPSADDYTEELIKDAHGLRTHNNRALALLLKELNITLWSVDKTIFFNMRPILEDIRNMALHLNWTFAMRRCNLNRHTLTRALGRNSCPTFQTVIRMLYGMGLRLRVEPDPNLTTVVADRKRPARHEEPNYKRNPTWVQRNAAQDAEAKRKAKKRGTLRRR